MSRASLAFTLFLGACAPVLTGAERPEPSMDAAAGRLCLDELADTDPFALDPDGPGVQIHIASALDNDALWLTWTAVDERDLFVIRAGRLWCDGSWDVAPFEVHRGPEQHLDSTVAVLDDRAMIAWFSDQWEQLDNLDIHTRVYLRDGTPLTEATRLDATRAGEPRSGVDWSPDLVATRDGFALAGSWATPDALSYQAFVQHFDRDGNLEGDGFDADPRPDLGQTNPTIAVDGDRTLHVAWDADDWSNPTEVHRAAIAAGTSDVAAVDSGTAPDLAVGPSGAWLAYVAEDPAASDIVVETPTGSTAVGDDAALEFGPAVGVSEDGAAVVWYRNNSGFDNALRMAWLDADGAVITEREIRGAGVPPYPINLTYVAEDTWFVAWQEGDNPDFLVHGAFVRP